VTKADIGHNLSCKVIAATAQGSGSATSSPVQATGCIVPELKGEKLGKAKRALKKANCKPGRTTKKPAGGKPGRVIKSKPRAGTAAPAKFKVALLVSAKR